jgi:hypothetical protein
MRNSVKKRIGFWLKLACIFLAGASAAELGDGPGPLDLLHGVFHTQVTVQDFIGTHATGDEIAREVEQQIIFCFAGFKSLPILFDHAVFQAHANNAATLTAVEDDGAVHLHGVEGWLIANECQRRALVLEQVAQPDLDLAVLVAQDHQNQFIKRSAPVDRSPSRTPNLKDGPFVRWRGRCAIACLEAAGAGETIAAHWYSKPGRLSYGGLSQTA